MILKIIAMRDRAADVFGQPNFVLNLGGAIRSFGDQVNAKDADNTVAHHPEDFDLYELGEYDDATASFSLLDRPRQIAVGKDLVK